MRVRASHPRDDQPVAGVRVRGVLKLDDEKETSVKADDATTDAEGYAVLKFALPRGLEVNDGELEITAQLGDFTQAASENLRFHNFRSAIVNTDKPLHQPGQTLHARLLAFDAGERAWAGQPVKFAVTDEESQKVFRGETTASRFGVATADWPIPRRCAAGQLFH